ncbi:MAG: hypothetical protein A2V45_14405 [Candidatus Aminicenantes bacterium RBG_19FT_COMBO_58_17]|nr:MAG: hypothetical protein A2V45_14405 [Candidatus Aminicenantes bacterium RBG_19FT_COMBO_58_17]HCS47579.1 hypothetical protein [Candidatus Aminicenantes bacterium]
MGDSLIIVMFFPTASGLAVAWIYHGRLINVKDFSGAGKTNILAAAPTCLRAGGPNDGRGEREV